MRRLLHWIFGWVDRSTAMAAAAMYLLLTIAFAVMGVLAVRSDGAAMGPVRLSLFAVLLLAHTVLHWFALPLVRVQPRDRRRQVAYCVIQPGLIFAISALDTAHFLTLGLWVTLLAETVALLWPQWRAMVLVACLYLGLAALDMALVSGFPELIDYLPMMGPSLAVIVLWTLVLASQFGNRQKAEALVRELTTAQSQLQEYAAQVEELTISQERQRMAREMHDTLAQGLAGLILQLEAADSHLERNRPADAQAAVRLAMQRARQTLHEARRAIQALRSSALDEKDLAAALAGEVSEFEAASGVAAEFSFEGEPRPVSPDVAQNVLRIVQESLSNVGRHAQARHVQVKLVQASSWLQLVLRDDGKGFDVEAAMQRPDCFGLQGMQERAERIGAVLRVESAPQKGTALVLTLQAVPEPGPKVDPRPAAGTAKGAVAQAEPSV